jgi:hypothetical protein
MTEGLRAAAYSFEKTNRIVYFQAPAGHRDGKTKAGVDRPAGIEYE